MKNDLRKKIVLGIASAVVLTNQATLIGAGVPKNQVSLTTKEQTFLRKLSGNAITLFENMDHDGRAFAMKILLHNCKGQNACKGQGINPNSCKGQNACKGQGSCRVTADDAVIMASKRQALS